MYVCMYDLKNFVKCGYLRGISEMSLLPLGDKAWVVCMYDFQYKYENEKVKTVTYE
jgi:hypothetical protein